MNDGFVKIFSKMDHYTKGLSFKGWLRKVMINTAIDYYRRNEKHYHSLDITHAQYQYAYESVLDHLSEKEIIEAIQGLPPSYRMVFNLYAIEGFKHEEIAEKLGISVGTSKSNLSMARSKLQRVLSQNFGIEQRKRQHGGG